MKWGCNYSKELLELLRDGELPFLSYIKAGAFGAYDLDAAFVLRPLLLHGFGWYERIGMNLEKAKIPKEFGGNLSRSVQRMNELAYYYESPHLAFHCLAYEEDMADFSGTPEEQNKQLYQRMKQNILFLKEHLQVPVLIENIDYCPNYDKIGQLNNMRYPVLPEVINNLVKETEIDFLFDLSHARVSAEHLGMDILEYCKQLPMDKVVEVHLSGSGIHDQFGRVDRHEEMEEEDYTLIAELFQAGAPEYVTLEYGFAKNPPNRTTSAEAIIRQVDRLRQIWKDGN